MLPPAPYTLPAPGDDLLAPARARWLRQTARLLLDWPHPLPAWLGHAYRGVRDPLAHALRSRPGDAYAALSLPQVSAPLHGGDLAAALPPLLLELARRRALDAEGVWWGAPVRHLPSAPLGVVLRFDPPRVGMLFSPGTAALSPTEDWDLDPARGEPAFLPLRDGGWLALHDDNPLAGVEAHPDKQGNALSLGDAPAAAWVAAIDAARAIVRETLPALADEHRGLLACVVPVGTHAELSLSASYREAVGVAYVSLHPDPVKMAEALVHETQHNKANLLSYADPLIHDSDTLHVSPVRPDPRPLRGVLLAVHAFLPVEAMLRVLADQGEPVTARLAEVRRANREGMDVLRAAARPTELGRRMLDGMDALERALAG